MKVLNKKKTFVCSLLIGLSKVSFAIVIVTITVSPFLNLIRLHSSDYNGETSSSLFVKLPLPSSLESSSLSSNDHHFLVSNNDSNRTLMSQVEDGKKTEEDNGKMQQSNKIDDNPSSLLTRPQNRRKGNYQTSSSGTRVGISVGVVEKNQYELDLKNTIGITARPLKEAIVIDVYAWVHIPRTGGSTGYNEYMSAISEEHNSNNLVANAILYPKVGRLNNTMFKVNDWNSPGCGSSLLPGPPYGGTHCSGSEIYDCLLQNNKHIDNTRSNQFTININLMTRIRHPVDRVISEYYWWKSNNSTSAWTKSMIHNRDNFTAWVLDDTNVAHNRQSLYFLLKKGYPRGSDDGINIDNCIPFNGTLSLDYILKTYGSVDALNNLATLPTSMFDNYAFIGTLENHHHSYVKFNEILFGTRNSTTVGTATSSNISKKNVIAVDNTWIIVHARCNALAL